MVSAEEVKKELLRLAKSVPESPLAGVEIDAVELKGGRIASKRDAKLSLSIADAMRRAGVDRIEREKANKFGKRGAYAHNTHSAVFAEVKVDEQIGIIRVTRVVSAVAAGRILNPTTARSQIVGSVVGGIGMALHEETVFDVDQVFS